MIQSAAATRIYVAIQICWVILSFVVSFCFGSDRMPVCEAKVFLVVFSSGLVDADNLACLAAEVTKRA